MVAAVLKKAPPLWSHQIVTKPNRNSLKARSISVRYKGTFLTRREGVSPYLNRLNRGLFPFLDFHTIARSVYHYSSHLT